MTPTKCRVLFVDDNSEDRELYRRLLTQGREEDYVFVEADSGAAGLQLLRQDQFDCVLLDYQLPDRDGLEFLTEWTQARELSLPAVVMLTGQGNEAVAVRALKHGAQDYLVKTRLTPKELRRVVRAAIEEVTRLRQMAFQHREWERLATLDDLTGLHNRRCLLEQLQQEVTRAQRYGTRLSVVVLDVDHFKKVNDDHGHPTGDRVLATVARTIQSALRQADFAARYGGEEFCVVAVGTDLEGAGELAERLRRLIAQHACPIGDDQAVQVTCSLGVAQLNERLSNGEQLLAKADAALYQAKAAGRNRVCRATPEAIPGHS